MLSGGNTKRKYSRDNYHNSQGLHDDLRQYLVIPSSHHYQAGRTLDTLSLT
jgi:hypothetical protein